MLRRLLLARLLLMCGPSVIASAEPRAPQSAMLQAALAFLGTLDPTEKSHAIFPFNSEERFRWFYTPVARKGISLKDMSQAQQQAALNLLHAGLSEKGYRKAESIRKLENVLRELEQGSGPTRDPELYFFTFFGQPSQTETWGWRYEGHHCSQNWTIVNGRSIAGLANSPQFFGANPANVRSGPMRGTRVLGAEEDLAWSLVNSLNPAQRADAVLNATAPADILTNNQRLAAIREEKGITYADLGKEQQGTLLALIEEYLSAQPQVPARARLEKIRKTGLDQIRFAWMGGLHDGEGHYYRAQGSTFLIEFDNTQNDANHIHCVWRDFNGDWGEDLLAQHYRDSPHHQRTA
jgi:Protein of unknown function (DUF3500)